MTDPTTPEGRARLRELHEVAFGEPWEVTREEGYDHLNGFVEYLGWTGGVGDNDAEVELIVAAVNALPALLAELEKTEVRLALAEAQLEETGHRAVEHYNRAERAEAVIARALDYADKADEDAAGVFAAFILTRHLRKLLTIEDKETTDAR